MAAAMPSGSGFCTTEHGPASLCSANLGWVIRGKEGLGSA